MTNSRADTIEDKDENALRNPVKFLKSLTHESALPDNMLSFKKIFIVMVLCNLHRENVHGNGTRHVLEIITRFLPVFSIATAKRKGFNLTLPQITNQLWTWEQLASSTGLEAFQVSVLICFPITTDKAHWQPLCQKLGINPRENCFSHG